MGKLKETLRTHYAKLILELYSFAMKYLYLWEEYLDRAHVYIG